MTLVRCSRRLPQPAPAAPAANRQRHRRTNEIREKRNTPPPARARRKAPHELLSATISSASNRELSLSQEHAQRLDGYPRLAGGIVVGDRDREGPAISE